MGSEEYVGSFPGRGDWRNIAKSQKDGRAEYIWEVMKPSVAKFVERKGAEREAGMLKAVQKG